MCSLKVKLYHLYIKEPVLVVFMLRKSSYMIIFSLQEPMMNFYAKLSLLMLVILANSSAVSTLLI